MAQTLVFKIFNYGTIYFIDKCHIHIQLIEKLICMDTVLEIIPLQGQGNLIGLPDISGLAGPLPVHLVASQGVQPLDGDYLDVVDLEPLDENTLSAATIEQHHLATNIDVIPKLLNYSAKE